LRKRLSAPHILDVSEDKHQSPSPVKVNVSRLITVGKTRKENTNNSIRRFFYSTDKIHTAGFLGLGS
jgi:hypothetical protein